MLYTDEEERNYPKIDIKDLKNKLVKNELKAEYTLMRQGRFTVDNIMSYLYGEQISQIPATYYNKDIKWLYKIIKYTIKQMRRTINRAVWYSMSYFSNNLRESFGTKIFNI